MKVNEEFKRLIPALSNEEFTQLERNCLQDGIRDAIVVWNDTIIDGHNRYEIAKKHGLEFRTESKQFDTEGDVKEWMIMHQFGRRNLSNYQRSVLALQLEDVFKAKAKEKQVQSGGAVILKSEQPPIVAIKEVAKIASVGHDTIAKVKVIQAVATPEVKAQLSTGEVSINQAYKDIKKEEKATLLVERKEREVQEATEIKPKIDEYNVQLGQVWKLGRHTLICGSAYESDIKEATAIITDPPYGIDYQADWKKWDGSVSNFKKIEGDKEEFDPRHFLNYPTVLLFGANYFTKHLPQGGWLCWDKRLKDELDDMVGSPFELAWFKSSITVKTSIMVRVLHGGVVNADSTQGNNQKRYHPTQKPVVLMEEILKKITREEEVICDPFCGSGTTLIAAENTGRTCIAYEIEPAYCNVILSRYEKLTGDRPCLE